MTMEFFRKYLPIKKGEKHLGTLDVCESLDRDYPGVDIELIADDYKESDSSRPRVLFEHNEDTGWRVLIWADKSSEDYTNEIIFH